MDFMDILLICGKKCNFRCKYCYTSNKENPFKDDKNILLEQIEDVYRHIDYYVQRTKDVKLTFYGGEPLVYPEFVEKIIERYKFTPNVRFALVTNGFLLDKYLHLFIKLPLNKIFFCVSYDYSIQDLTRSPGTYEKIREVIKKVCRLGYLVKTITTIDVDTAKYLKDIYEDHLSLLPLTNKKLVGRLNIFEDSWKDRDFNFEDPDLLEILERIRKDNLYKNKFGFHINSKMLNRKVLNSNKKFLATTYAICPDGIITWDVRSWWFDKTLPYLTNGFISEDPEEVFKKRQEVLEEYGGRVDPECVKCPSLSCKIPAFHWHQTEKPIYWCTPPDPKHKYHCDVSIFFSKYLGG